MFLSRQRARLQGAGFEQQPLSVCGHSARHRAYPRAPRCVLHDLFDAGSQGTFSPPIRRMRSLSPAMPELSCCMRRGSSTGTPLAKPFFRPDPTPDRPWAQKRPAPKNPTGDRAPINVGDRVKIKDSVRQNRRAVLHSFTLIVLRTPSLPFPSLPFPSLPFPSLPFPSLPFPSLPFLPYMLCGFQLTSCARQVHNLVNGCPFKESFLPASTGRKDAVRTVSLAGRFRFVVKLHSSNRPCAVSTRLASAWHGRDGWP
eukprot:SAG31_NODE_1679_length_7544_cov_3.239758_3_plen_256_part_00